MNKDTAIEILNSLIDDGILSSGEIEAVTCLFKYIKHLESENPEKVAYYSTRCCRTCKNLHIGSVAYGCKDHAVPSFDRVNSCPNYEAF